jgi:MFS family permease
LTGAVSSLRVADYRRFAGGQVVRLVGLWMHFVTQDWLVLELSGDSAVALGLVGALQFTPILLLTMHGGALADRVDNRRVLLVTNAVGAALTVLLGVLVLVDAVALWHVYTLAFLLGVASAVEDPNRQAYVSRLVPDALLPNALSVLAASFGASRLIGPGLAGLLIAAFGTGPVFLLIAAGFLGPMVSLARVRARFPPAPHGHDRRVRFALAHIRRSPDLLLPLGLMVVASTFALSLQPKLSLLAKTEFRTGAATFGVLSSALAVGSVLGAVAGAWRRERPAAGLVVTAAVLLSAVQVLLAFVPSFLLVAALLVPVGFSALLFNQAVMQRVALGVEPALRGRTLAAFTLALLGTAPLAALLIGWSAATWGVRWTIGVGAAITLVAALAAGVYLRSRRDADEPAAADGRAAGAGADIPPGPG